MEYFRGFSVFFDDPDCVRNLLLASLLLFSSSFIPFVGQMIVIGWAGFIVMTEAAFRIVVGPITVLRPRPPRGCAGRRRSAWPSTR